MLNCTAQVCLLNMKTMLFNTPVTLILAVKAVKEYSGQWVDASGSYLLWLVSIGQRCHHPDDVEVGEGSAGGKGAGQDGCLATSHLDTALGHCHI